MNNSSATPISCHWSDNNVENQLKSMSSPMQTTSSILCNKRVLNRFSSCSLKPIYIIGSLVTFVLIAINPPAVVAPAPSWIYVCAAYNRLDETQNVAIAVYGLKKSDLTRHHRTTSMCWYRGPVWGLTAPPTIDGPFSPCWKLSALYLQ